MSDTFHFTLDGKTNRTLRDWNFAGRGSAMSNARRWALMNGTAGAWRADESFILFSRNDMTGKVSQRTYKYGKIRVTHCAAPSTKSKT